MDKYSEFEMYISKVANTLKSNFFQRKIKLISHFDADGIAAGAIVINMLNLLNVDYEFLSLQQLNEKFLFDVRNESGYNYIFSDVGSGQLSQIVSHFRGKHSKVLVLDHHKINGTFSLEDLEKQDIFHVNCHDFGLDGAIEISGAGTAFLFSCQIDKRNEKWAHLGIIGAIGDVQIKNYFSPLNKKILNISVDQNVIQIKKELNFFGIQTKNIARLIESGSNIKIPSITGNRVSVNAFLNSLHIDPLKKYYLFTDIEKNKLAKKIIEFRKKYFFVNPEDIYADEYILVDQKPGSVFRDLREFSTLLNACGRLSEADVGVGACLNDEKFKKKALDILQNYKSDIVNALNWYEQNKNKKSYVLFSKKYVVVNAQENISANIVGTLASILSKSKMVGSKKYVLTMGRNKDNTTKISLRYSGKKPELNIRNILSAIVEKTSGETGGHDFAAGAIIEQCKESDFIGYFIEMMNIK